MVNDMPEPLDDVRKEAIDIYDHIDKKELRESYLAHIPQLGMSRILVLSSTFQPSSG